MDNCVVFIIAEEKYFFVTLEYQLKQYGFQVNRMLFEEKLIHTIGESKPAAVIIACPLEDEKEVSNFKILRSGYSGLLVHVADDVDINIQMLSLQLGGDASWNVMDNIALVAANFHALLRKCGALEMPERFEIGSLLIDRTRQDGFLNGEAINLSTIEFHLLWLLVVRRGKVVSRKEIHWELYNNTYNGYDRSIDLYISRIRQKIGDNPQTPRYLKTIRGAGYLFITSGEKTCRYERSWN